MTEQELINLGFKKQYNHFRLRDEFVKGDNRNNLIRFSYEEKVACFNRAEFCIITRTCNTIEELSKFIECIDFLFNNYIKEYYMEKTKKEFKKEFSDLLKKYDVEILLQFDEKEKYSSTIFTFGDSLHDYIEMNNTSFIYKDFE